METSDLKQKVAQLMEQAALTNKQPVSQLDQLASQLQASDSKVPDASTDTTLKTLTKEILVDVQAYVDNAGGKLYILTDPRTNQVRTMTIEQVADALARGLEIKGIKSLLHKKIMEHAKTWAMTAPRLAAIPPSVSLDPNTPAFVHVDISKLDNSLPTPTWDNFIANCGENGPAVMAFTWSVFEQDKFHSQYLFLKGSGKDGKGSYTRWLNRLLRSDSYEAYAGLSAANDRWPAMLIGKRIGIFNDIKNTAVVMSSEFKQITGGDAVTINPKHVKAFTAKLDTLFILTTNEDIMITGNDAEKRRAIIVNMRKNQTEIADYENKLKEETNGFLAKCRDKFNELYDANKKYIACDYEHYEMEVMTTEEQLDYLFDQLFEYAPGHEGITAHELQEAFKDSILNKGYGINNFRRFIENRYDVKKERRLINGKKIVYYTNIKLKQGFNRPIIKAPITNGGKT